jgi:hypothetical protein
MNAERGQVEDRSDRIKNNNAEAENSGEHIFNEIFSQQIANYSNITRHEGRQNSGDSANSSLLELPKLQITGLDAHDKFLPIPIPVDDHEIIQRKAPPVIPPPRGTENSPQQGEDPKLKWFPKQPENDPRTCPSGGVPRPSDDPRRNPVEIQVPPSRGPRWNPTEIQVPGNNNTRWNPDVILTKPVDDYPKPNEVIWTARSR